MRLLPGETVESSCCWNQILHNKPKPDDHSKNKTSVSTINWFTLYSYSEFMQRVLSPQLTNSVSAAPQYGAGSLRPSCVFERLQKWQSEKGVPCAITFKETMKYRQAVPSAKKLLNMAGTRQIYLSTWKRCTNKKMPSCDNGKRRKKIPTPWPRCQFS